MVTLLDTLPLQLYFARLLENTGRVMRSGPEVRPDIKTRPCLLAHRDYLRSNEKGLKCSEISFVSSHLVCRIRLCLLIL